MCGICGLIRPQGVALEDLVRMNRLAAHRGPDGEGYWLLQPPSSEGRFIDSSLASQGGHRGTAALGHRRLAILDLTDAGLQPMPSADRKLWIVFNGEIYNYLELRSELSRAGHKFMTCTDTEVILAAYQEWGTDCFARFNGMWGLAIMDLRRRLLVLSRDRLGVKPLYLWAKNGAVAFASEIKQLLVLPGVSTVGNRDVIAEYIDTGYDNPPATFFKEVQAFAPGCWGEVSLDLPQVPSLRRFWFPEDIPLQQDYDLGEAAEVTRDLFENAVAIRLRSDVPVGVCLSGGLDSSAVYGQAQRLKKGNSPLVAFSAAFNDQRFDERPYINTVLDWHKGTGQCAFPTADSFLQDLSTFVYHHDEPPGSLSPHAAWSVMRLARQNGVPVLLNGQGGDELFCGYWAAYYLFLRRTLKSGWRHAIAHLLGSLLPGGNPALVTQLLPHLRQYRHRKKRNNRTLLRPNWQARGVTLVANWALTAQQLQSEEYRLHEIRRIHLPRLLKWDDRNSMAFGIEGRYPFLDYRLVEWVLRLPTSVNLHRGWNKLLVRNALGHLLPPTIRWRRSKVGFETPQSEWLRTTLRQVISAWSHMPSKRLQQIVDPGAIKGLVTGLLASKDIHRKDENQILVIRLFLLDQWLNQFDVDVGNEGVGDAIDKRTNDSGPSLGSADPESGPSPISVIPMRGEMIDEVCQIHVEAFAGYMNTQIGLPYVKAFVTWFCKDETAIALVAQDRENKVMGYLVGAPFGYGKALNRRLFWTAFKGLAMRPWLLLTKRIRRQIVARIRGTLDLPEPLINSALPNPVMCLVGIGVATKCRGMGVGERLVKAFEERARILNMKSAYLDVYPDNHDARRLYEKCGWAPVSSANGEQQAVPYYRLIP